MLLKHPDADRNSDLEDTPLVLGEHEQRAARSKSNASNVMILIGVVAVTFLWIGSVAFYIEQNIGFPNLWRMLPHEIGAFFAGAFAPLAFLWLLFVYFKRGVDNKLKGQALDALMQELGYPSPEAEARVASLTFSLRRHGREVQVETENAATSLETVNEKLEAQQEIARRATSDLKSNADMLQVELEQRLDRIAELISKTDDQKETLEKAVQAQTHLFGKAADDAEARSETVNKALSEQIYALENAVVAAEDKSLRMTRQLEQTSQDIAAVANHTLDKAEIAGQALSQRITNLADVGDEIRTKLDAGADHLQLRTQEIESFSVRAAAELLKAGDELRQNSSDLSVSSEGALSRLEVIRDGLNGGSGDVERAIERLEEKQARFKGEAQHIGHEVRQSSEQLVEDTDKLTASVHDLKSEVSSAGEKLRSELRDLEDSYKKAENSLGDVEALLGKGQSLLQAAGEGALENAVKFEEHMADHAEKLLDSSDLTSQRTSEVQEKLRKQMAALTLASGQIQEMSLEISARLTENVDLLSEASISTSNQVVQVGSGFQRQADEMKSTAERVSSQIKEAGENLRRETNDIELHAERTSKTIKSASEELEKRQRELGSVADQSKTKLSAIVEETIRHHQEFMATAERSTLQARQSGEAARSQTAELAKTAERASAQLRNMGEDVHQNIEHLTHIANKAGVEGEQLANKARANMEHLNEASLSAKEQMAALAEISESAKNNSREMEKILQKETTALSEVARQLADKAEVVEATLSERVQLFQITTGKADTAGEAFKRKTLELAKASELMLNGLVHADQALGRHQKAIENTRSQAQNDLENVMLTMTEAGQQAHGMSEEAAQEFKQRTQDLIKFSDQAYSGSQELIGQFDQQRRRLEATAQQVENSIGETAKILSSEGQNLKKVAGTAAEEALISSLKFQEQAEKLEKASKLVQRQTEEITDNVIGQNSKAHQKASSFILDSLHSLSIDLARNLDSSLSDDLWKKYRRGDKSIFSKRLVKTKDAEKIRTLYKGNGDFRRYVDQYRAEFEGLLKGTEQTEFSELLLDTYTNSDVGKVYLMLSDALDANG
ncbi:MAG: hypothetical protein V7750_04425 [Sneathiella sp.]